MKFILLLFLIIIGINTASASYSITENVDINMENGAYIHILAIQNGTNFTVYNATATPKNTFETLTDGQLFRFNSSANFTLYNISYSNGYANFTIKDATADVNYSIFTLYPYSNFRIYKNNVSNGPITPAGALWFNNHETPVDTVRYAIKRVSPYLISPANHSTTADSLVDFEWYNEGTSYGFEIATDVGFTNIIISKIVASATTTQPLILPREYFWRVRTYSNSTYGDYSPAFSFNLSSGELSGGDNSTGIQGFVYDSVTLRTIPSAIVQISNATWTDTTVTDDNGYYLFKNLTNSSLYSLKATAKNYNDGSVELVTTVNNTWVTKNILLQPCTSSYTCNINQHFVRYIIQSLYFTRYNGIEAKVYKGSELTQTYTQTTGAEGQGDGVVNFWLIKDQEYTITFINASQGISTTWKGYPASSSYYIIVSTSTGNQYTSGTDQASAINVTVSTSTINTTHAYVNISYSDTLAGTSNLKFYLNQSIAGDPNNQTNLQSISAGSQNTYNASFVVQNYGGQSYIIALTASHTTYGTLMYAYGVHFPEMPTPLANFDPTSVVMLGIGFIFFIAGMFGQTTTTQGAGIVVGASWILQGIAVFTTSTLGTGFILALTLATIIVIIMNINERKKKEMI